jgi:hypothetical protein
MYKNVSCSCLKNARYRGFVTRLTRRVSLVEQELVTLPEYPSSPLVFSGVRVSRSLVLCVCFVDRCLFFFDILILITLLVSSNSSCYLLDKYGLCVIYTDVLRLFKQCYSFHHCSNFFVGRNFGIHRQTYRQI